MNVDDEFNGNNEINEDVMESDNEDDVVGEDNEKPIRNEEGGNDNDNDEDEEPTAEGVEGANDIDTEDVDMDSAVKQELGEKEKVQIIKSWKKIMILELQELPPQWIKNNNNNNKNLKKKKINLFKMMHVKSE